MGIKECNTFLQHLGNLIKNIDQTVTMTVESRTFLSYRFVCRFNVSHVNFAFFYSHYSKTKYDVITCI